MYCLFNPIVISFRRFLNENQPMKVLNQGVGFKKANSDGFLAGKGFGSVVITSIHGFRSRNVSAVFSGILEAF